MRRAALLLAPSLWLSRVMANAGMNMGPPVKEKMPWYHSTDEVHQQVQQLSQTCEGFRLETRTKMNNAEAAGQEINIDVVRVGATGGAKKAKAFLVFNEHARELITAESALGLLQALCGQGESGELGKQTLQSVEFTIVPNANPLGRKQVESGAYCKRTNEDGVDLNRNWGDEHRDAAHDVPGDEMNPGPRGFSEPESELLQALVQEETPDLFLSIHSGAYLLGTPFGYTGNKRPENVQAMVDLLGPISREHCGGDCPYGDLAEMIHYNSMGCDIDWVMEHVGTPYAYTWEIYVGEQIREGYIEQARERAAGGASLIEQSRSTLRGRSRKAARRSKAKQPEDQQGVQGCIDQFLPQSESETRQVVNNWAGAYLQISQEVAKRVVGDVATTVAPANATAADNATAQNPKSGLLAERDEVFTPLSVQRFALDLDN